MAQEQNSLTQNIFGSIEKLNSISNFRFRKSSKEETRNFFEKKTAAAKYKK